MSETKKSLEAKASSSGLTAKSSLEVKSSASAPDAGDSKRSVASALSSDGAAKDGKHDASSGSSESRKAERKARRAARSAQKRAARDPHGSIVAVAARLGWFKRVKRLVELKIDQGPFDAAILEATPHYPDIAAYLSQRGTRPFTADALDAILTVRDVRPALLQRLLERCSKAHGNQSLLAARMLLPGQVSRWWLQWHELVRDVPDAAAILAERAVRVLPPRELALLWNQRVGAEPASRFARGAPLLPRVVESLERGMSAALAQLCAEQLLCGPYVPQCGVGKCSDIGRGCEGLSLEFLHSKGADLYQAARQALLRIDWPLFGRKLCPRLASLVLGACRAAEAKDPEPSAAGFTRALANKRDLLEGLSALATPYYDSGVPCIPTLRVLAEHGGDLNLLNGTIAPLHCRLNVLRNLDRDRDADRSHNGELAALRVFLELGALPQSEPEPAESFHAPVAPPPQARRTVLPPTGATAAAAAGDAKRETKAAEAEVPDTRNRKDYARAVAAVRAVLADARRREDFRVDLKALAACFAQLKLPDARTAEPGDETLSDSLLFRHGVGWARKPALQVLFNGIDDFAWQRSHAPRSPQFWDRCELLLEAGASLHEPILIPTGRNLNLASWALRYCSLHEFLSWRSRPHKDRSSHVLQWHRATEMLDRLTSAAGKFRRQLQAKLETLVATEDDEGKGGSGGGGGSAGQAAGDRKAGMGLGGGPSDSSLSSGASGGGSGQRSGARIDNTDADWRAVLRVRGLLSIVCEYVW